MAGEQVGLLEFIAAEKEKLRREREELLLDKFRLERSKQNQDTQIRRPASRGGSRAGIAPAADRRPPSAAKVTAAAAAPNHRPPTTSGTGPAAGRAATDRSPIVNAAAAKSSGQDDGGVGNSLQLGEYEQKRKRLEQQRQQEYRKYLEEKKRAGKDARPPSGAAGKRPSSRRGAELQTRGIATPCSHPTGDGGPRGQEQTVGRDLQMLEEHERKTRKELADRKAEYAAYLREQDRKPQQRPSSSTATGLQLRDPKSAQERLKEERRRDYHNYRKSLEAEERESQQPTARQRSVPATSLAIGSEAQKERPRDQRETAYHVPEQHAEMDRALQDYPRARQYEVLAQEDWDNFRRLAYDPQLPRPIHSPLQRHYHNPLPPLPDLRDLRYYDDLRRQEALTSMRQPADPLWDASRRRQLSPIDRRQVRFGETGDDRALHGSADLRNRATSAPSRHNDRHPLPASHDLYPLPSQSILRPSSRHAAYRGDERLTTVRPLSPMYKVAPMFLAGTGSESRHGAASPPRLRSAGQRRPPSNMGLRRSTLGHHVSDEAGGDVGPSISMVGLPSTAGHHDSTPRDRDKKAAYREELKRQMEEKAAKEEAARKKREREQREHDAENESYDPWGKSGAGAPNRDRAGKVVADLRQMRTKNDKGTSSPEPRADPGQVSPGRLPATFDMDGPLLKADALLRSPPKGGLSSRLGFMGDAGKQQQHAGQGTAPGSEPGPGGGSGNEYRDFLRRQIEEKAEKKRKEEERQKKEEEEELKRIEEEKKQLEEQYQLELERQREKDELAKKENKKAAEDKAGAGGGGGTPAQPSPPVHSHRSRAKRRSPTRQADIRTPPPTWQAPRAKSPPVPAVRKMLSGGIGEDSSPHQAYTSPPKSNRAAMSQEPAAAASSRRTASPPVPALRGPSPAHPAPPQSQRQHWHSQRTHSPPVPALQKAAAAAAPRTDMASPLRQVENTFSTRRSESPPVPALHDSRKRGSRPSSRQRTDRKATASPMLAAHATNGGIAGLPSNGAAVTAASTSQPGALTSVAQQLAEMRRQLDNEQQRLNMRMKMSEHQFAALADVHAANYQQIADDKRKPTRESNPAKPDPEAVFSSAVFKRKPRLVALTDPGKIQPTDPPLTIPEGKDHVDLAAELHQFNRLKYRKDAAMGRDQLKSKYPEPPTSADSIDRQQNALLRQQHKDIQHFQKELLKEPPARSALHRRFPASNYVAAAGMSDQSRIDGMLDDTYSIAAETAFMPVDHDGDGIGIGGGESLHLPLDENGDISDVPIMEAARQRSAQRQRRSADPGTWRSSAAWLDIDDELRLSPDSLHHADHDHLQEHALTSRSMLQPGFLERQNEDRLRRLRDTADDIQHGVADPLHILNDFVARRPPLDRAPSPSVSLRTETTFRPTSTGTLY
ncbi:zinc finger CCCH domain-containing protein 13-like isoform X2 [Sycon ciliatum]|uniref:zinc finger CCCH domain-containing protein 13-like isoform X2 n=1 Tax=Sycon ciliatum TaxID=27933 RepID=UPI0031F63748